MKKIKSNQLVTVAGDSCLPSKLNNKRKIETIRSLRMKICEW